MDETKNLEWSFCPILSINFTKHLKEINIYYYNYESIIWWKYIDDIFFCDDHLKQISLHIN